MSLINIYGKFTPISIGYRFHTLIHLRTIYSIVYIYVHTYIRYGLAKANGIILSGIMLLKSWSAA